MTNIMEQEKYRSRKQFVSMLKRFSEMYNQMLSDEDYAPKQIEIISLASSIIKAVGEMEIRCEYVYIVVEVVRDAGGKAYWCNVKNRW